MNPIAIIAIIAAVFFAFVAVGLACCLAKTHEQLKRHEFIDLGLPSGTLWAAENATLDGAKHFTYNKAVKTFGFDMPTADDFQELYNKCDWKLNEELKGYTVTGPNGNSIFLPALGIRSGFCLSRVGSHGYYWSRTADGSPFARVLAFWTDRVCPQGDCSRRYGCSVRLVRRTASVNVR